MSLQVAVDHENLVAAGVRAGSLSHLLMMLFYVLLKDPLDKKIQSFMQPKAEHTESCLCIIMLRVSHVQ